jgi:hypothetical protein
MADYRQMWTDLGMDLEKHDLLCEAMLSFPTITRGCACNRN